MLLSFVRQKNLWEIIMNDPIVEEVRKYRNEHTKHFNYDLDAICADLIKHQSSHPHRLVNLKNNANKVGAFNRLSTVAPSR